MPELPEVETIVRRFRPLVEGRRITAFTSRWPKKVSPSAAAVRRALVGVSVTRLWRRAKYIIFDLDCGGHLLVHLRMSGRFEWAADHEREPPHVRAVWRFGSTDRLWFVDARKFGTIRYVRNLSDGTAHLGVEPLERAFSTRRLTQILSTRSRRIKALLLDQTVIAGLGNIYVDEALHRARIHPVQRSDQVDAEQVLALHRAIKVVLRNGIRHNGASIDWIYPGGGMQSRLRVYGRTGKPCRSCGTPIEAIRVGQRGTHFCPNCQKFSSAV